MSSEETRVVNADQITYNVDSTIMESMNFVDHVVLIEVVDLVNHVDYHVELSNILIIALSKTSIGNVDLIVSSVIDHTTPTETIVLCCCFHFDVLIQPIFSSVAINLVNYIDPIVPTKFVVTSTETMIEHIMAGEILIELYVLCEVMIDNTILDESLGKVIVSPDTIIEYIIPTGSVENEVMCLLSQLKI